MHAAICIQQQQGEQRALPGRADSERRAVETHSDGSEDAESDFGTHQDRSTHFD